MTTVITFGTIQDARNGKAAATDAIYRAMEGFLAKRARHYAGTNGHVVFQDVEDMMQEGATAVLMKLGDFKGRTIGEFWSWVETTVNGTLNKLRLVERNQGVSRSVAELYEKALARCDYNMDQAEKFAASDESSHRMSPEMARAARIARQGAIRLDAPITDSGETLRDVLADELGVSADLVDGDDVPGARRRAAIRCVHAVLNRMTPTKQVILKAQFGVSPIGEFPATKEGDAELAAAYGLNAKSVPVNRARAKQRFAALWVQMFGEDVNSTLEMEARNA